MNVSVVPQRTSGLLDGVARGTGAAFGFHLELAGWPHQGQRGDRAGRHQGGISVYATDTTNVIVDIDGYFAPVSSSTLAFYPLPPCRVADTRYSTYPQGLGPPFLTGDQERAFPILNATTCNIPSSAAAYSLNFSVVPHGPLGYMTVWPTGQSPAVWFPL